MEWPTVYSTSVSSIATQERRSPSPHSKPSSHMQCFPSPEPISHPCPLHTWGAMMSVGRSDSGIGISEALVEFGAQAMYVGSTRSSTPTVDASQALLVVFQVWRDQYHDRSLGLLTSSTEVSVRPSFPLLNVEFIPTLENAPFVRW